MRTHRAFIGLILIAATLLLIVGQLGTVAGAAPEAQVSVTVSPSPPLPPRVLERAQTPIPDADEPKPQAALIADIPHDMDVTAKPGKGRVIGTMPGGSKYFGKAIRAWVLKTAQNGRFGKVTLPWSGSRTTGWIELAGLQTHRTPITVEADLSEHRVRVMRLGKKILSFPAATGASASPTPPGRYFVTDRIDIPKGGSFGTYAFGLSGIQTRLPVGWTGGNQLAIHGTSDPGSIGTSASAGCLRVSESALDRLKPLLALGTPVTIKP